MGKRKQRNKLKKTEDLTLPVDMTLLSLTAENDPCFGKLHDLTEVDCMNCGDSEFCQMVMAQSAHSVRKELAEKNTFKDLEEVKLIHNELQIKKFIKRRIKRGKKRKEIIKLIKNKFDLSDRQAKEFYTRSK